jgi:hypothetical protein
VEKTLNVNLHRAKKVKNDEFYTLYSDVEKEIKHYKKHLEDKTILFNCNDYEDNNFWKYFYNNFKELKIKKIISIRFMKNSSSYMLEFDGEETKRTELLGDGDFRNAESIEILKKSDIVITNPPFSLFREYINQLVEYDKKFLIIGNFNSVLYKNVFELIKNNKIWIGVGTRSMNFLQQDGSIKNVNACWLTNLEHEKREKVLDLTKKFYDDETAYKKYDNYDIIEVSKVNDIPYDYNKPMGVPINFLENYNPEQFEIIGCSYAFGEPFGYHKEGKSFRVSIEGKEIYKRFFIQKKNPTKFYVIVPQLIYEYSEYVQSFDTKKEVEDFIEADIKRRKKNELYFKTNKNSYEIIEGRLIKL